MCLMMEDDVFPNGGQPMNQAERILGEAGQRLFQRGRYERYGRSRN